MDNAIGIVGPACYNLETGTLDNDLCKTQALYLQKQLTGNINMFDGAVLITPEGTVKAKKVEVESISIQKDSKTVGTSVIQAGEVEVSIENSILNENSRISLILTSDPNGQTLFVKSKEVGKFVIGISKEADTDISFDWWILQVA